MWAAPMPSPPPDTRIFMPYSTLLLDIRDGIATITINRPDKLNALNASVIRELGEAAAAVEADPAVRGVILTGAGPKAFVAGADISELASQTPLEGKARSLAGQAVFRRFEAMRKPVVAAINGFCLGGGCELAMACHIRIASETARFGQPEVKLGIGPGYGATVRLPRLVGRGRAIQLLLTGEMIDAQEAWRIGLVNRVVPAAALGTEAETMLGTILDQGPLAVAAVLEAVDAGYEMPTPEALLLEANHFGLLSSTSDMREGMAAFLEKRKAAFRGV
jgi:enoyl-CoA hydratase